MTVTVTTDAHCTFIIDGKHQADLYPGEPRKVSLSLRAHKLEAVSSAPSQDRWEGTIDLSKAGTKPNVDIELLPIQATRLEEERKAAEAKAEEARKAAASEKAGVFDGVWQSIDKVTIEDLLEITHQDYDVTIKFTDTKDGTSDTTTYKVDGTKTEKVLAPARVEHVDMLPGLAAFSTRRIPEVRMTASANWDGDTLTTKQQILGTSGVTSISDKLSLSDNTLTLDRQVEFRMYEASADIVDGRLENPRSGLGPPQTNHRVLRYKRVQRQYEQRSAPQRQGDHE